MSVYKEQEFTKQFDAQLWKRLLTYAKPYKKHLILLALIMMAVGGIDVIFPLMTRYAIDHFVIPGTTEGLQGFALAYAVLVGIQTVNVWMLIAVAGKIEMGVCYDIRKIAFQRLQELSFSYYDKTAVGWIMARMTSDIQRLSEILSWGLVDLVWGGSLMTAIMAVLLYLNWKLALITLVVAPFLVMISLYFQRKILASYRQVRKVNSRITGAFNEGIMGAKTSKTLVREEENLKDFQLLTKEMFHSSVRAAIFSSVFLPVVLTLGSVGTGLAIWFGGRGVLLEAISFGTLVAFISYTIQFFEPVRELARIIAELQAAQASAERVLSMIHSKPEIVDEEHVVKVYGDLFHPKKENWPQIHGNITFQNVSFTYEEGEKVLENFNLEVKAGEKIALVGETGSGKSTIVNLLCRFYEPTEGKILIDGIDYRQRSQLWLQSNLGYVLQTPHLFSGTIRENIQYGRLEASEDEILEAAKLVNAHPFIMQMEKGYDTQVGEGGNRLSTGEKQLISFARAILANPKIFVLDEATSSIDTETEQRIEQAIEKVLQGRTSFIIAHRLSTIRSAHRILVLRNGKVIEAGSHRQLIGQKGYYYELYTHQFKEDKEIQIMQA
ncbi:ATP-binding cassette, subfamily B [Geosporobacter subterraneus DSM 17957]|uniref:ATP-binding cassette, subfamily B n=1 Tax=Geosporobacter subterraneus DSM 17957 TaxID=1121919 RepID=A0A1M6FSE8_9FIRM|nr:ABC transporter ATP-binding protein [Geosporobacter subterraneus]SHJ00550.1 ATP-binding cassette, subfamily B [Geosporobacter subterraneus DSM 17957]